MHGIPRGLYINGLFNNNIELEIICFADDTIILIHDKNLENLYTKADASFNSTKSWFGTTYLN
jgi:hypothetical protein